MHRSKLVAIGIDCQNVNVSEAAKFWGAALGREPAAAVDPAQPTYLSLGGQDESLLAFCQNVEHPSGVHLDIETDDVDAEVKRLEALGATRLRQVRTWWVMQAPTGHRFCVVRPQRGVMPEDANVWDE